jgi:hypothetical protein
MTITKTIKIMLQTHFNQVQSFPVEDHFIRDWFTAVIESYELTGSPELTSFRNYEINYEFEQPKDFVNRVIFLGRRRVTLFAQKVNVEFNSRNGYPIIRIIRKNRRKPLLAYGKD